MEDIVKQYDVRIKITPKSDTIPYTDVKKILPLLKRLGFWRSQQSESLTDFRSKKITLRSPFDSSNRTFEFDSDAMDIVPVVYLEDRIANFNDDDTPDFDELDNLAKNIFRDEVLPELRPDLT